MQALLSLANVAWVAGLLHGEGPARQSVRASARLSLPHFWPQARGQPGAYGFTGFAGPMHMNGTLSWKWTHPGGPATNVIGGPLIDGNANLYVAALDGVRKFHRDGRQLWYTSSEIPLAACPSLMGDRLFGNDVQGNVFALNLETGEVEWSNRLAIDVSSDAACVQSHNGVVVTGVQASKDRVGNMQMLGINASTGNLMWSHNLSVPVRNVMPLFEGSSGASTILFMDVHGGVQRRRLGDGTLVWYATAAGSENSYSEGGLTLGRDGNVYACSNPGTSTGLEGQKGMVRKYDQRKGDMLWEAGLPSPCNSWPAVSDDNRYVVVAAGPVDDHVTSALAGQAMESGVPQAMSSGAKTTALATLGAQHRRRFGMPDLHGSLVVLEASSGKTVWTQQAEPYVKMAAAGTESKRPRCAPPHWGAPTLAKHGTGTAVYVGRSDGFLYAFDPLAGGTEEKFYTGVAALHPGASFGPGVMAYTDCDALHVFDVPETARAKVEFEKEEYRLKKAAER